MSSTLKQIRKVLGNKREKPAIALTDDLSRRTSDDGTRLLTEIASGFLGYMDGHLNPYFRDEKGKRVIEFDMEKAELSILEERDYIVLYLAPGSYKKVC